MDGLTPGRIVCLVLDATMVDEIERRRTTSASIRTRLEATPPTWPAGAQAHLGNPVQIGQVVPATVVAVFGSSPNVNLQALLDGSDTYWATSVPYDNVEKALGTWHWPVRA